MTFIMVSFNFITIFVTQIFTLFVGKLRAFSGSSMMEMKNIRDQQEKLSKLHFDLGMSTTNSNDSKSSDHMAQLVQRLNEISHSIEKLNSSNVD